MIRSYIVTLGMLLLAGPFYGQQNQQVLDYITTYRQLAIDEMIRTGVPASITLAQGIHETEAGKSDLVLKSNNHFGIKCKSNWNGEKVYHDDDARGECFRSYTRAADSYRDHSDFLKNSSRYAFLFTLDPADYKGWAYGLKKAGYATNNRYWQILVNLVEKYNLQQYTLIALGKLPALNDVAGLPDTAGQRKAGLLTAPVNYPEGEFRVNDTRVIFVKGGTSLLSVAEENKLALSRLLEFNDMTPGEGDILAEDQLVYLQRKRKTGSTAFHIVQPEETLYDIAQIEGVRYESLLEMNRLSPGMEPLAGEKIFLQGEAFIRPELNAEAGRPLTHHRVQKRETLLDIGRKYGVKPEKIVEWNKLSSNLLKTGQELIIYTN